MGEVSLRPSNLLRPTRITEAEGLSFSKKGEVTYVTGKQVAGLCEHEPIFITFLILLLISILAAHKI